jgi:hypothetical protein
MSHTVIERSPIQSTSNFPPGAKIDDALGFTIVEDRDEVVLGLIGHSVIRPGSDRRLCIAPRINARWFFTQEDREKADALAEVMEELLQIPQFCQHFDGGVLLIYCDIEAADRELLYCAVTQLEFCIQEFFPDAPGWDLSIRRWPRP